MKTKVSFDEVIDGAKHQINANFVTIQGDSHLVLIIPMNLFDDDYAIKRFNEVVSSDSIEKNGQYYFQLISNLNKPGLILNTTPLYTIESYLSIINSIYSEAHRFVKSEFKW